MDLRERVLVDCDAEMEVRQVAVKSRVSESSIRRLEQRRRESGQVAPQQMRAAEQPDATLAELKLRLGLPISLPTLRRALPALTLTFPQRSSTRRSQIGLTSPRNAASG